MKIFSKEKFIKKYPNQYSGFIKKWVDECDGLPEIEIEKLGYSVRIFNECLIEKSKIDNKELTLEQLYYLKDEMSEYIKSNNCNSGQLLMLFRGFENSLFKDKDYKKYYIRRVESKRQELLKRAKAVVDKEEQLKLKHQIEILGDIQFL